MALNIRQKNRHAAQENQETQIIMCKKQYDRIFAEDNRTDRRPVEDNVTEDLHRIIIVLLVSQKTNRPNPDQHTLT